MDIDIFFWINSHHNTFLDLLLFFLSAAGKFYILWWALGVVVLCVDRRNGIRVMLCMFLALLLVFVSVDIVLKPLIARPRPFVTLEGVRLFGTSWTTWMRLGGFSFPSGHCASSMAAAWVFGSFYRRYRWLLFVLVVLMAYSRVYLGVHYPSDCLAGIVTGLLCGVVATKACGGLANSAPLASRGSTSATARAHQTSISSMGRQN
jgi:undecaprenyl-diphosphatase